MLSDTQGQGCTASSTGRLSCSVPAIVCSTEMCPWQRPMRPEGKAPSWLIQIYGFGRSIWHPIERPLLVESED